MFGKKNKAINTIILLYKRFIYEMKMKEQIPHFRIMKMKIIQYIKIEKMISRKNNKLSEFDKKWENLINLLNEDA